VQVDTDDTLPGFGHLVFDVGTGVVAEFSVILIVVGVLLPFFPISAAVGALLWWIRRRNRKAESPSPPAT